MFDAAICIGVAQIVRAWKNMGDIAAESQIEHQSAILRK